MSIITEDDVRKMLMSESMQKEIFLGKDQIITPSARSYLTEHNVAIKSKSEKQGNNSEVYTTLFGAVLDEKPEHMTHLRGNTLVFKNHPRIKFRGAIDTLESEIIKVQTRADNAKFIGDLEEIIKFVRNLLRCEVSGESVGEFKVLEFDAPMLREYSHHPSKYYGISHFLPTYKHGRTVAELNGLRTLTRKTELTAYDAFSDEYGRCGREDIIKALNRLSSLFWIMMFKCLKGEYGEKARGNGI